MALVTGKILGPYEILAPLGAGGMGGVYRARESRRFLVAETPNPGESSHLDVVVTWFSEVARKLQESSAS